MKKYCLVVMVLLLCMAGSALANDYIYIANPNPADRLHLRLEPRQDSVSLGRYYNGAPIERNGPAVNGFQPVVVGYGSASQLGYMDERFVSWKQPENAMPQYVTRSAMKAYATLNELGESFNIGGGELVFLMGVIENTETWYHLMVCTGDDNPHNVTCFVRERDLKLIDLTQEHVHVYTSNPDKADRLHLRTEPRKTSKSLGKYYNGTEAQLLGFSLNGEWLEVELYGRTGYMMRDFLSIEGGPSNRTWYGIPTVQTVRDSCVVFADPERTTVQTVVAKKGSDVEVLGLVNEEVLHVRTQNGTSGFMRWADTNFTD